MSCFDFIHTTKNRDELLNEYEKKKDDFLRLTTNYQFVFEITKCCGYGEWVSVFKNDMTSSIYDNVGKQFTSSYVYKLFVLNNNGDKLVIPRDGTVTINNFILMNRSFFTPIYPLPTHVIYRLFLEETVCHHTHETSVVEIDSIKKHNDPIENDDNNKEKEKEKEDNGV
jgi:hypothetical protein